MRALPVLSMNTLSTSDYHRHFVANIDSRQTRRLWFPSEATIRTLVFALTIATIFTAALNFALAPSARPVRFELAANAGDLQGVEGIKYQTYADFLFVGAYAGLWCVLGASVHPILPFVVIAGGVADVFENVGILRAITRAAQRNDDDARWIRTPSYVKWSLLAVVWIALAFVPASLVPARGWRLSIALPYAVAGVMCLVGLVLSSYRLVGATVAPISVALLAQLFVFRH